jgi:short-subunit dehydrogenase
MFVIMVLCTHARRKETADLKIQCIFNNAGFIVTGFYDSTLAAKQESNMECNCTAVARITQHFVGLLVAGGLPGCVVFTSSVVAYLPSPFSIMYGATKAFVSNFAASLSVEVRARGIDVLAIHPSPVASNFYTGLDHKIEMMDQAAKGAVLPSTLPDVVFKSLGRVVWRDIGGMAISVRLVAALLPYNLLTTVFAIAAPFLPDYKKNDVGRGGKKA